MVQGNGLESSRPSAMAKRGRFRSISPTFQADSRAIERVIVTDKPSRPQSRLSTPPN